MRLALAALLAMVCAASAEADPACARLQDPLAFNACLARQGPRAAAVRPGGGGRAAAAPHKASGSPPRRRPNGRVRMEFSIPPRR